MILTLLSWNSSKQLQIGSKKRQQNPKKTKRAFFGDLIASQLRQLPYHERVMAKMEISNVLYVHLLRKNSPNQTYSAGGFVAQDQRCDDMAHIYRHTNVREATPPPVPSFAPTEMQSADNHVFPQGYFFQQTWTVSKMMKHSMFNIHSMSCKSCSCTCY